MHDKDNTPRATHSCWPVSRSQLRALLLAFVMVASLPAMSIAFTGGMTGGSDGVVSANDYENTEPQTTNVSDESGVVAIGSDYGGGTLRAYHANNGTQIFQSNLDDRVMETAYDDGVFYTLTAYDGCVGCDDTATLRAVDMNGDQLWSYEVGLDDVGSELTVIDGIIYFTYQDELIAFNPDTQQPEWTAPGSGNVHVVDGVAYTTSGNSIVGYDAGSGSEVWNYTDPDGVGTPNIRGDTMFYSDGENITALNTDDESVRWSENGLGSLDVLVGGYIYNSNDNSIQAIDASTGDTVWTWNNPNEIGLVGPTFHDGRLYAYDDPPQSDLEDPDIFSIDAATGETISTNQNAFTYQHGGKINTASNSLYVAYRSSDSAGHFETYDLDTLDRTWGSGNIFDSSTNPGNIIQSDESVTYQTDSQAELAMGGSHSEGFSTQMMSNWPTGEAMNLSFERQITGSVEDQENTPVANATVSVWGTNPSAFQQSENLNETIDDLESQLNDPLPDEFNESLDLTGSDGYFEDQETNVVAVHSESQWDLNGRTIPDSGVQYNIDPQLEEPKITAPSGERVVLSIWNPTDTGGTFLNREDAIDESLPGRTTTGTVVVEQLSPTGGVKDTRQLETEPVLTANPSFSWDTKTHEAAVAELPSGVYRVYPEGHKESAYMVTVGEPDELVDTFAADIEDQLVTVGDQQERLSDLLGDDRIVRKTVETDANGEFSVDMPAGVNTAQINAMRADGTILEGVTDPGLEDLREAQLNDYNGTFYLPSPRPNTVEPPASNVTVNVYRSPEVPLGDLQSFADLQEFLEQERLNETISELESEYDQRFNEMERERLENVYNSTVPLVENTPGSEDRYLDQSEFEEIQNTDDLTNDELATETGLMREALTGVDRLEPPTFEDGDPGEISEGLFNAEYPLPGSVDEETVTPELHYPNGTSEEINEVYWEIESGGTFGLGDQTLVVSDVPIPEDTAGVELRVQGVGDGARLDDRISARNPAFGGSIPEINAVDFSTVAPGPSEQVSVGINPAENTGYDRLVSAEAWNDDGQTLPTALDTSKDRASFTTDGQGVHTVRLTYETQQGDRFVLTEKVDAKQQSRSDPATIRAAGDPQSMTGLYAVTGEELDGARLESNGGTLSVDALAENSDGPSQLSIQPSNAMVGTEHTIDVNVLHGSAEERVSANIPVNIHIENPEETTIYWRSAAGFGGDPITHNGDTRFGSVEKPSEDKHVVRTYTEPDGSLTVTTIKGAGWIERSTHRVAKSIGGIPFVGSIAVPTDVSSGVGSGGFIGGLGLAGIAAHRRRTQP